MPYMRDTFQYTGVLLIYVHVGRNIKSVWDYSLFDSVLESYKTILIILAYLNLREKLRWTHFTSSQERKGKLQGSAEHFISRSVIKSNMFQNRRHCLKKFTRLMQLVALPLQIFRC